MTPEQLAAIAAENEEPEPVNYKPPAQKSVKEIQELDKDDESLRKYKEALLGAGVSEIGNAVCLGSCMRESGRGGRKLVVVKLIVGSVKIAAKCSACELLLP